MLSVCLCRSSAVDNVDVLVVDVFGLRGNLILIVSLDSCVSSGLFVFLTEVFE